MKLLTKKEIKKKFKEFSREKEIAVILEDIQYATNVAQVFRTCDAAGVRQLYLTGITTKPPFGKELSQTSRSKENSVGWQYFENTDSVINKLKSNGFVILAVELTEDAKHIDELRAKLKDTPKVCLIVGNEVHGVKKSTLAKTDLVTFIPMYGRGASLNVGASLAIALYAF